MIRSVIAAIKNSYKPLCKQESDNLWCRGKLLISIKREMNSSRIELLWLVWDQSRSKYYLRTKFQDGIDKPQKCWSVWYHPTHQQQSDFLISVLWLYCSEHSVFIVIALLHKPYDYEWLWINYKYSFYPSFIIWNTTNKTEM